jgi:hypothetical protein
MIETQAAALGMSCEAWQAGLPRNWLRLKIFQPFLFLLTFGLFSIL